MNPDSYSKKSEKEATEWIIKEDQGVDLCQLKEFVDWKNNNPDGYQCYLRLKSDWDQLDQLKQLQFEHGVAPDPDLLLPPKKSLVKNLVTWYAPVAALIVFCFVYYGPKIGGGEIAIDELVQHPVKLLSSEENDFYEFEDGSVVELNAHTEVEYQFTEDERNYWVKKGEAYFTVAKDPNRPFRVYANDSVIQALGTEFNVRLSEESLTVLVTEGRVAVMPEKPEVFQRGEVVPIDVPSQELIENQRADVFFSEKESAPEVSTVAVEEIDRYLSWKPQTLNFSSTPLYEVVAQFNALNDTLLLIGDERLTDLRIDASFRSNNIEAFVRLLEMTSNISAYRDPEGNYVLVGR